MSPLFGYHGKILRADLSKPEFTIFSEDQSVLRKYVGGAALGAKYLYEEVPPGVAWSDPANRIILASGPLGGTSVMGSGTFCAVTKGARTNGATSTQSNGYLGAYMRFAGFDAVIIQGKAERLSYLYIHDGTAELRDARHLAGKDTWEVEDLIKQEVGLTGMQASVYGIGVAGEKMVKYACLMGDRGHAAATNGIGAVFGSKNLKAVVIARGKNRVPVFDAEKLSATSKSLYEMVTDPASWWSSIDKYGTLWIMGRNALIGRTPFKNYQTADCPMTKEQLDTFSPQYLREKLPQVSRHVCWGCRLHHLNLIKITEGPLAGQEGEEAEYEGYAALGVGVGIYDGITATALCNEADRLGIDHLEIGYVLSMVMEMYEKGLLTKKDTDGIDMTWGNVEAVRAMLNKIARREGIGDILAEGVLPAASHFGKKALDLAIYTKNGTTIRQHDHRVAWTYILDLCTSGTGQSEANVAASADILGLKNPAPFDPEQTANHVVNIKGASPFVDSLGVCRFPNPEMPEKLTEMVKAATGWHDFAWDEALKVGLRSVLLMRAFNIRHGYDASIEGPSPRYGSTPTSGPAKGHGIIPVWKTMLDAYYKGMKWDRKTGKPTPEALKEAGLPELIPDLWPDSQ